jgi:sugar phosphate isomerase/epimerase
MPRLAAFPKAWMQPLCVDGSLSLEAWIGMATTLEVDGLEFYSGFLDLRQRSDWGRHRKLVEDRGLSVPMLCCSPDFTHPDAEHRRREVEKEKVWIEMAAALGCSTCRVLSGQRRPEVSRDEGLGYAAGCIEECLPSAEAAGITLVIENHYKDDFWQYPEFAQAMDVFCDLVDRIDSPHFGVNYDPSNTLLAGEDPLELLRRVRHRVVSMHASDRFLAEGTIEDLRREESSVGYARRLSHGEIGKGLNDYDAIFAELQAVGFDGWISIEDGVDGMEQMKRSVDFLREKMRRFWPER